VVGRKGLYCYTQIHKGKYDERKGLYVQATQKGYIWTRKAQKKERKREREKGALRPINANRLYTDE